MNYDSQYESPLTGPEQIRLRAVELLAQGDRCSDVETLVEKAKLLEEYVIGQRATDMQKRIDDAHRVAFELRREAEKDCDPWTDHPETVPVTLAKVRELETLLSKLAEVPF